MFQECMPVTMPRGGEFTRSYYYMTPSQTVTFNNVSENFTISAVLYYADPNGTYAPYATYFEYKDGIQVWSVNGRTPCSITINYNISTRTLIVTNLNASQRVMLMVTYIK